MKKISIVLLAVFFIGITNVNAQTDATTETVVGVEEVKEIKTCAKTGKVCDETCKNKAKGTCCKGKKSSCSKKEKKGCCKKNASKSCSKKEKKGCCKKNASKSCSKKEKKGCCKKKANNCGKDCTKPCCVPPPPTIEKTTPAVIQEIVPENE